MVDLQVSAAPTDTPTPAEQRRMPTGSAYAIKPGLAARLARRVVASPGGPTQECVTPMTGEVLATLPTSSVDNVEVAYRSTREAQKRWARTPIPARARVLERLHDLVLQHQDELMDLIQLESGKARRHAFEEILDVAGVCRHYARKAQAYLGPRKHLGALPIFSQSVESRLPKGVVGIVGPWNYPLSMSITDAMPALLAGNAVVLRPDDKAALTALRTVELLDQAGLPEGVLQVVLGDGPTVGAAVLDRADYVMFTGSTATGRTIAANAGRRLVGASLELGGKNPMYVAADANLAKAAECAVRACFSSGGQLCISIERMLVHEKVVEEFTRLFVDRVKAMRIGPNLEWGYDMGSLISADQLRRVEEHVEEARAKGATVLAGGKARPDLGPYFYEPTVLSGVTAEMVCRDSETFGPVVSIYPVRDDAEAIALANDTTYGLNASIFTRDVARGRRIASQIRCGTVNINEGYASSYATNGSSMGGMKDSGLGRRHGAEGILKYTEAQNVTAQYLVDFGVPKGMPEKVWARTMTAGVKLMKAVGLS